MTASPEPAAVINLERYVPGYLTWISNKLSGGALGDIVGELGKGLIKGVLGMTAGVVNITAGVVKGPGGLPGSGGPGAPVAGGKPAGRASGALTALGAATIFAAPIAAYLSYIESLPDVTDQMIPKDSPNRQVFFPGSKGVSVPVRIVGGAAGTTAKPAATGTLREPRIEKIIERQLTDGKTEWIGQRKAAVDGVKKQTDAIGAIKTADRASTSGLSMVATTTRSSAFTTAMASVTSASRIVSAIAANKPVTNVYVSAPGVNVRYGPGNGSAGYRNDYSGKPLPPP
jgi:hypothetical protein